MRMKHLLLSLLTSTCLAFSAIPAAEAQETGQNLSLEKDSVFTADEIQYDQKSGKVVATGNVEIAQGERILRADKITYDIRAGRVTAVGNIALMEPTGEVLFAEAMELQNELKVGVVNGIRILFTDNSRLAANSAQKLDENRTRLNQAVYSTCDLCKEDRNADPLWQLKSNSVEHNKTDRTITYKHAVLEFYGVPVLYTPYFSHPDPTVDRESGFLAPAAFDSSILGYGLTLPYYYVISDDKDLTFTPTITTKEGVQLATEYRQAFESGDMVLDASLTYVDERTNTNAKTGDQEFQGHIRGLGEFDLKRGWSWGFDFFATTTDTYLDKYDISEADTLVSTAYIQALRGRNYGKFSAYAFQGLEADDDSGTTPFVPAWLEYSYISEPDRYGSRYSFDLDSLMLFRTDGQDTNRISGTAGWHLPYTTPSGQVINLDAKLRGDMYYAQDQLANPFDPDSATSDEFTGRVIPSISLKWSYPFVRQAGKIRQTIEPIAEVVWSEAYGSDDTPNEDSLSFEFDDTNLFGTNRYVGLDEVEEGLRFNYGFNFGFYGEGGGYTSFMVGQSIYESNKTGFQEGTGLESQVSDYVARLEIQPADYLKYTHRVRVDQDNFSVSRNEIDLFVGSDTSWMSVGYLYLDEDQALTGIQSEHQVDIEGRLKFAEFWSAYGGYIRDLEDNGSSIQAKFGIEYLDECFGFALEARRDYTRDRDLEPSTSIGFKIRLLPFN